jgi:hypothetical protein
MVFRSFLPGVISMFGRRPCGLAATAVSTR